MKFWKKINCLLFLSHPTDTNLHTNATKRDWNYICGLERLLERSYLWVFWVRTPNAAEFLKCLSKNVVMNKTVDMKMLGLREHARGD